MPVTGHILTRKSQFIFPQFSTDLVKVLTVRRESIEKLIQFRRFTTCKIIITSI